MCIHEPCSFASLAECFPARWMVDGNRKGRGLSSQLEEVACVGATRKLSCLRVLHSSQFSVLST